MAHLGEGLLTAGATEQVTGLRRPPMRLAATLPSGALVRARAAPEGRARLGAPESREGDLVKEPARGARSHSTVRPRAAQSRLQAVALCGGRRRSVELYSQPVLRPP